MGQAENARKQPKTAGLGRFGLFGRLLHKDVSSRERVAKLKKNSSSLFFLKAPHSTQDRCLYLLRNRPNRPKRRATLEKQLLLLAHRWPVGPKTGHTNGPTIKKRTDLKSLGTCCRHQSVRCPLHDFGGSADPERHSRKSGGRRQPHRAVRPGARPRPVFRAVRGRACRRPRALPRPDGWPRRRAALPVPGSPSTATGLDCDRTPPRDAPASRCRPRHGRGRRRRSRGRPGDQRPGGRDGRANLKNSF
jgi:hypothetical protein